LQKIHHAIDRDNDGILTLGDVIMTGQSIISYSKGLVGSSWQGLLYRTQSTFDKIVPSPAVDEPQDLNALSEHDTMTLGTLRSHVSDRLKRNAWHVWYFSAERLKDLLHVDLILYAERVHHTAEQAQNSVKPRYDRIHAGLHEALLRVENSVVDATAVVGRMVDLSGLTGMSSHFSRKVSSKVSPLASELKRKLAIAVERAQVLSNHSNRYILNRQLTLLPGDCARFFTNLMLVPIVGTSQPDMEEATQKIKDVLQAIKDVFFLESSFRGFKIRANGVKFQWRNIQEGQL